MHGLMMDVPLTLTMLLRRAAQLSPDRELVTRRADRSLMRSSLGQMADHAERLGAALLRLGLRPGERVATFSWNHQEHVEAYFGVPMAGGVLHTLNLRLHPDDLAYIATHAGDRVAIVDASLWPLFDKFRERAPFEHVFVVADGAPLPPGVPRYDELLANGDTGGVQWPVLEERAAAAMCYTSGTTGRPKGVVYSHRSMVLHSFALGLDAVGIRESDTVLPVVPMFHVNAWGIPYACAVLGAKMVLPGPFLDPASLLDVLAGERVTFTAGVPTIWMGLLQLLDKDPGKYDLSSLRTLLVGGAAAPRAMIEGFEKRHGLRVVQAWGMTETSPLGSVSNLSTAVASRSEEEQFAFRAMQGRPAPLVEIRARGDAGLVPWDGKTMGELEVRGPWIASSYFAGEGDTAPPDADRFTDDGWFRTGDIVTITPEGYIGIQDRAKDLIKSGGEWISSVTLENTIMGHPAVAEAAVIAVADERWGERPLAAVVLKPGETLGADELRDFLAGKVAKWWVPERVEFVETIPKTSVGKFKKRELRQQFA